MIRNHHFVQLEATNKEGKTFCIGGLIPAKQFSDKELSKMESSAQKVVDEYGIRKRSPSRNWRTVISKTNRYPEEPLGCMDLAERFICYDGNPIVVSQPYFLVSAKDRMDKVDGKLIEFADKYGIEYIRRDDLSYHYPGRTTLIVWKRRKETVYQHDTITAQEAE